MESEWKISAIVVMVLCLSLDLVVSQPEQVPVVVGDGELEKFEGIKIDDCHDVCVASGDPHFNTFDCVKYEYHGKCNYTLVKNCGRLLPSFEIIGEFHRQRFHRRVSVIKKLLIIYGGTRVELDDSFNVLINGVAMTAVKQAFPPPTDMTIKRYVNAVYVRLGVGLSIYWSSPFRAVIQVDDNMALFGNLCGLCGNNNDIKFDDFTTRFGQLVSDVVVLGDSWRTDESCGLCHDCDNTVCNSNPHNAQLAEQMCDFIDDSIPACGDENAATLQQQCKDLLCATLPEVDGVCHLFDIYVDLCSEYDIQVNIPPNDMCNPGCKDEGGAMIPYGNMWINSDCTEKCYCDERNGVICEDIMCDSNAKCQPINEDGTNSTCVCNRPQYVGNGFECKPYDPCDPNRCQNGAQCVAVGLRFACLCKDYYHGPFCENPPPCDANPCKNGGTCVNDEANYRCVCPFGVWGGPTCEIRCYVCWACGDPHYYTFDGVWYDFQGKCMYTLAESIEGFANQFQVVGNNIESYRNSRVSVTRQVFVFLDFPDGQLMICFHYGYGGISVNGTARGLPYQNTDASGVVRVEVRQAGSYTLLSTNFGLYVVWNGVHCVCIIVPETFVGYVQGLCGLFNKYTGDEWTKPNNELARSPNEFGNSWVYEDIEVCTEPCTDDTCGGNPCEENPGKVDYAYELCLYLDETANMGPFAACFEKISPRAYFGNCKYDICAGQDVTSICDDMANYVFDCRAAGVNVSRNWRDLLSPCAIDCGENMEYMECGPACPPTCANPAALAGCTEQCLEGCFCKEGYLWTPDGCVQPGQCGCTLDGVYYAPNAEFILEDCSAKCTCRMGGQIECVDYGPCDDNAECTVRDGRRGCYCPKGYFGDGFNCAALHMCTACGDPHYRSFDGKRFDFQGKCTYTLVKNVSGDIEFEVIAKNVEWNHNPLTSITRQLFIHVYGKVVWFNGAQDVRVDGVKLNALPYFLGRNMRIFRVQPYTILQTDFGLIVIWDGNTCVHVLLPDTFQQKVLGLCGNFNGDYSDDFTNPQYMQVDNVNDFGNSWEFGIDEDCVPCTNENCQDGDPCDVNPNPDVAEICSPLYSDGSPFEPCFFTINPKPYIDDCSYDACAANGDLDVCEHLEAYVTACLNAGVVLNGWRKAVQQCMMDCPAGMTYTDCGTACPASCADPNSPSECTTQTCIQGCQCLPGLLLSGNECVEPNQCGCQFNGRYYMPMERFVTSDCGLECTCLGNNQVECNAFTCGENAVCDIREGVRDCYCQDGFIMLSDGRNCAPKSPCDPNPCQNGGECIESADLRSYVCRCPYRQWAGPTCSIRCFQCYACGDPHYKTLDGAYYDFQGKCKYTLVKTLDGAKNEFQVEANNIEWAYYPVTSITREIYVYLSHRGRAYVFCFKYTPKRVLVNDISENLPYYLYNEDGSPHLVVERRGYRTVLYTEYGLIVEWNGSHCVTLYLPETFKHYVAGLCGLFDGNPKNDRTDSDFNQVSDWNAFGNSWVYGECANPCTPDTCTTDPCADNAEAAMRAEMVCQVLDTNNGMSPFKDCFDEVNPAEYFHNCKFDMCIDPTLGETLCGNFDLYVTACREAGVPIGNWRAAITDCAIPCGEYMEYQYCGTACPATCSTGAPDVCTTQCVEGCQCVQGYVWTSNGCVREDECGCTDNGSYYDVGETVVSDDCTTECTCESGGTLNCQQIRDRCNDNEVCEVRSGRRGCYCPDGFFYINGICQPLYTCYACGDPHYRTFNGKRYDYMGKCSYILAQTKDYSQHQFAVVGDNIPWEHNPRATVTHYVKTYVYGKEVKFSWDTADVLVNDKKVNLPFDFREGSSSLIIRKCGVYTYLVTDFGLQVEWDGKWCVFIRVPAMFMSYVNGLCGYFSESQEDDFMNPNGGYETDVNTFGDKWAYGDNCEPCTPDTCLTGDPCDDAEAAAEADRICSPLTDVEGPFADCFGTVDPAELLHNCRYDMCADPEDRKASCSYLREYARKCREAGVPVNGWRDDHPICAIECGKYMTYSDCGSACPATCVNPTPECNRQCVEGCQCLPGLVLSGNTCVTIEQCGCTNNNGEYYLNGERFMTDDCNMLCRCRSGEISCQNVTCDANAICALQNGVRRCYCNDNYEGNGLTCTAPCDQDPHPCMNRGECIPANNADGYVCRCPDGFTGPMCERGMLSCQASGDPHYKNFDNQKFDFQGSCQYILAQNCNDSIPAFTVIVGNEQSRWNSRVSLTRTVTVEVYGQIIFLGQRKVVQINSGGVATLPVMDPNFDIYKSGRFVVVKTDFDLIVEWNGFSTVRVKVPEHFAGNLCGLCGNGNGIRGDDMLTPTGGQESNINNWGYSWATNDDCDKCEECPTGDVCEEADDDVVASANDYCSVITATVGVFGQPGDANLGEQEQILPVEEVSEFRPQPARRKRELVNLKTSTNAFILEASSKSDEFRYDIESSGGIHEYKREYEGLRRKRQAREETANAYVTGVNLRWSATNVIAGSKDNISVNATVGFYEKASDSISGTGLWKLAMYGSKNDDGTGDQFHLTELLSEEQQAQPLVVGEDIVFVDAQGSLDITALGCDKDYRYLCFDFTKGNNPNPDFTLMSFQIDTSKFTLCSDRCPDAEPTTVTVTGLEVRIQTFTPQPDVRDAFTVNATVHFDTASPDVNGIGLWKLSVYGSTTDDGSGEHFQHADQVLSAVQQTQPLVGGADIVFVGAEGVLDIADLGCGEFQYVCIDFMKGDNPSPDFDFKSVQPESHKYTLCVHRTCEEDFDIDISDGFILVADLGAAIKIAALSDLRFKDISPNGLQTPVALDYDPIGQRIYWTDVRAKTISSCYLNGTGEQTILNLGDASVADGIAIDVQERLIYWTDTGYDRIERANLDGSGRTVVLDMGSDEPRAIVLCNGFMYWTDWGEVAKIERAKLDGSERETLVDTDLFWPNGLAVDCTGQRMYWIDAKLDKIESSDLNGNGRTLLLNLTGIFNIHPFDIGVYQDVLLLTDWAVQGLIELNVTSNQPSVKSPQSFARPGGVYIQHGGCTDKDGNFVPEGYISGTPCHQCKCIDKQMLCWAVSCAVPDIAPGMICETIEPAPGQCCPTFRCYPDCTDVICARPVLPIGAKCALDIIEGECCPTWSCLPGEGPFVNCHDVINPQEFFDNCRYDWCATQSHEAFCEDIAAYATACQRQGIRIANWREGLGCAIECQANAHYELCSSSCLQTCADLNDEMAVCPEFCQEGCVCDDGYILEGETCVPKEDCGCFDDNGIYHLPGVSIISEDCVSECECVGAGEWNCKRFQCGANAECGLVEGERGCVCKTGFVLQGNECVGGCTWGNRFIPYGKTRFNNDKCKNGCSCSTTGEMTCSSRLSCGADATCVETEDKGSFKCGCGDLYFPVEDGLGGCFQLIPPP